MCALVPHQGWATDFSKKIPTGSSYGEVLSIWGEPVEKVEEGILKQTIWYYKDGAKVVFKNGRVRSFRPTNAVVAQIAAMHDAQAVAQPVATELAGETRDLVRDIAKEVPSGPDVPYIEQPGSAALPVAPNPIPPGGRGAGPVIVPGEEIDDEE